MVRKNIIDNGICSLEKDFKAYESSMLDKKYRVNIIDIIFIFAGFISYYLGPLKIK